MRDGKMFYTLDGKGPALLMLHAGVADSRMWQTQIDHFAERFTVVCFDLRGYGRSPLPNGSFAYHKDAKALVDALELSPFWIIGASFGARVAIDFALSYPDSVKGLVLLAPALGGFRLSEEVKRFGAQEGELLEAGKLTEATELNLRMWVDGPYPARSTYRSFSAWPSF